MANTPGGSFIPKRSTGKVAPTRSGRRIYIFSYVAYVLFFGTLLSVVGIFFLNQQAEKQLTQYILEVEEAQRSINRAELESIREFDDRLKTAKKVLNQHAAPSVIFEALETVVVQDIQFNKFEYARESGGIQIVLGGLTNTFDVLLFQRDVIKKNELLASADIVEVGYGIPGEIIEGVDRSFADAPIGPPADATVTFVFENETALDSIGYTPRSGEETPVVVEPTEEESEGEDAAVDNSTE